MIQDQNVHYIAGEYQEEISPGLRTLDLTETETCQEEDRHVVHDMKSAGGFQPLGQPCDDTQSDACYPDFHHTHEIIWMLRHEDPGLKHDGDDGHLEPGTEGLHEKAPEDVLLRHALKRPQNGTKHKSRNGELCRACPAIHQYHIRRHRHAAYQKRQEKALKEDLPTPSISRR